MKSIKNILDEITKPLDFSDVISEGVYDPGIFKAVFMSGGPGSGKSAVAGQAAPQDAFGLKVINSDKALEYFYKKKTGKGEIDMDKMTPDELEQFAKIRGFSKELTVKHFQSYIENKLGVLIDGTGDDYQKIAKQKEFLERLGYDTYMVFVNTSLDVARARNNERERSVSDDLVKKIWSDVQNNIGAFQKLFGSDRMKIVDNSNAVFNVSSGGKTKEIIASTAGEAREKASREFGVSPEDVRIKMAKNQPAMSNAFKEIKKFVDSPLRSSTAKEWINKEMEIRKK